jgi:hypothetical protein
VAVSGVYFNLPLPTLYALQTQFVAAIAQLTTVGQSYTIGNRSYSLIDIKDINQSLLEINAAILKATGRRRKNVVAVQAYRDPVNPVNSYY